MGPALRGLEVPLTGWEGCREPRPKPLGEGHQLSEVSPGAGAPAWLWEHSLLRTLQAPRPGWWEAEACVRVGGALEGAGQEGSGWCQTTEKGPG